MKEYKSAIGAKYAPLAGSQRINGRRSIRLKGYDYSRPGAYFVTIAAKNRDNHFGKIVDGRMDLSQIGRIIYKLWIELPAHFNDVQLDEYVIMPNHLHGIIIIDEHRKGGVATPKSQGRETLPLQKKRHLGHVIGFFKYQSAKYVSAVRKSAGLTIWQRNYYERIIRSAEELNRIREYIKNNHLHWIFDKENPERVLNEGYQKQCEWIEGGK